MSKNILVLMCDQFRFDCIGALGNSVIQTPNLDRLIQRGVSYTNAYSTCPVCVPARYTLMTGCEPARTGCYLNEIPKPMDGQPNGMEERCGAYLARELTSRGYRTFGIGKFHTKPDVYEDLGFETHMHTEELWETEEIKAKDSYAAFIRENYPEYNHIDQLHGERTNMYYVPQTSPLPAEITVEAYVADRAIDEIKKVDQRPFFGYVSFIGPHPPCAPPIPFNLMYDPDLMTPPNIGDEAIDTADEQIRFMNHAIYAEDISIGMVKNIKSRYYAEISYIDACIGRILDAVEKRDDADETMIIFSSDHGDHLGDHRAWQKESFFEPSTRIPLLVSAPWILPPNTRSNALVSLTDLYAIVTAGAGDCIRKDGVDLLNGGKRETVIGTYGRPGTALFKMMVRHDDFKYIFIANGGRELLFDVVNDPGETVNLAHDLPNLMFEMRAKAVEASSKPGMLMALKDEGFRSFPYQERPLVRIHQFEFSKSIHDFMMSSGNYISSP